MDTNNLIWFIFLPIVLCYPPQSSVPDVDHLHNSDDYLHQHPGRDYGHDNVEKRPDVIVLLRAKPEGPQGPYQKRPYYGDGKVEVKLNDDRIHHKPVYISSPDSHYSKPYAHDSTPVFYSKEELGGKDRIALEHALSGGYLKNAGSEHYNYHGNSDAEDFKGYYGGDKLSSFGGYHDDDDDDDDDDEDDSFDHFSYPFSIDADDYKRR